jgi:peptidyl-tRNA hydrolase
VSKADGLCDYDVFTIEYGYTEDMLEHSPERKTSSKTSSVVVPKLKTYRMVLAKPLNGLKNVGAAVKDLCEVYGIKDQKKQLIVAYQDIQHFPGSIQLANTSDSRKGNVIQNCGVINIEEAIGFDFIRMKLGVGSPTKGVKVEDWLKLSFEVADREIKLFGHTMDQSAQAIQSYISSKNLERTKRKYCTCKLPSVLQEMPGLVFPVKLVDSQKAERW